MTLSLNSEELRKQFPSLDRRVNGQRAIFLDGPGGTQTPLSVVDAMAEYLLHNNSNRGGAFVTSRNTASVAENARTAMADLFNARQPEEIVFGQNMTSLTFAMSRAISRTWRSGDEIIVSWLDHDANISPWLQAAADKGVTVRWLDFRPEDCTLNLESLSDLLNEKTRLLAITHASNAVGTIVNVAQAVEMAHQVGAHVYVDAVHYTPHGPVDVQALDCDFLVASAYKFFGPHTGILYGRHELLDSLEAYKVRPASDEPPGKWETGTQSFESLAGVHAAVEYLDDLGRRYGIPTVGDGANSNSRPFRLKSAFRAIKEYEEGLSLRFLQQVATVSGLRVYGITDIERLAERAPTFAVSLEGYSAGELANRLGQRGLFVYDGHYYAVAVMERLGLLGSGGLVRVGFVHYNTADEVDRTIQTLGELGTD